LPSRARRGRRAGVVDHGGVEGIADSPLEGPQGFLAGVALDDLGVVDGSAVAVAVADLGDAAKWIAWLRFRLPGLDRG
jgi:hypothetical protein